MKPKVRKIYPKVLALLAIPFILSGCAKNVDCDIPERHVHKYIGFDTRGIVTNYFDSEREYINKNYPFGTFKYQRKDDYLEITKDDEEFYKVKGALFKGEENWHYLYNLMLNNEDYMEYEYKYRSGRYTHYAWTQDKNRNGLTGKVRVYHYKYYGYKITCENGEYVLEMSPYVDDIRDILDEYPYVGLGCFDEFHKGYKIDPRKIPTLKLSEIDEFKQPDLTNKNLYTNSK